MSFRFSRAALPPLLLAAALFAAPVGALAQAPADSARVYELAEVESPPRPVNVPELRAALDAGYPADRLQAGAGGVVTVSLVVGVDGTVRQPRVVSSTDPAFDAASLGAIAVLRFTPATAGGAPVPTRVEIPITWQAPAPAAARADSARPVIARVERPAVDSAAFSDADDTYELAAVEEMPRPTNVDALRRALERNYPPELRAAEREGTVQVRFRVTARGTTEAFSITQTTDERFNAATVAAVTVLQFRPAKVGGRPVAVWVELPVQWRVDRSEGKDDSTRRREDAQQWDPRVGRPAEPNCGRTRC